MNKKIRIGLPKGNIHHFSSKLLSDTLGEIAAIKKLHYSFMNYDFFFLKHKDIARMIKNGELDFGITSEDWIFEYQYSPIIVKRLDWCHTKIALISDSADRTNISTCVSEYPNIAAQYFRQRGLQNVQIYSVSGSCEALVPHMYDCCIDCVETGSTIKTHNLFISDVIMTSDVVFVANASVPNIQINELLMLLFGVSKEG